MNAVRAAALAQLNFQSGDGKACGFARVEAVRRLESEARFSKRNNGLDVGFDVVLVDRGLIVTMPLSASLILRSSIEKTGLASNDIVPNG